jgi:hypothetical protein
VNGDWRTVNGESGEGSVGGEDGGALEGLGEVGVVEEKPSETEELVGVRGDELE